VRLMNILRLVLSFLLLGVIGLCGVVFILPEFQPTALQQLLRLTDLPQDLTLAPDNPGPWGSHDFTVVQQALLQKVPLGSDEASIRTFLAEHQTPCETTEAIIYCRFYRDRFPCRTNVRLQWFLNEARQLERIQITDDEACL
jgi:hypothetical protein